MEKWLGVIAPLTVFFSFLLSTAAARLIQAKLDQVSRAELTRIAGEWRQAKEDGDKLLVGLREQQQRTQALVDEGLAQIRGLDRECMNLTREHRACREYVRQLVAILRLHGLPVPADGWAEER